MPEQGPQRQEQQEALGFNIDQELSASPDVPQDRRMTYDSLSRNKEIALAGLLLTIGTLASTEAQAEIYYERPGNVKSSETEIMQNFKEGDENTVYRYGIELESLTEQRTEQGEETVVSGEVGRAIIEQIARMMTFCKDHNVNFEDVYDTSKMNPDFVKEARKKYVQALMISEQEGTKNPTPEKFAKTTTKSETLRRTSR
ncbi:MAG: hypothetical protein WC663_04030 [Patescibacteria group bacterium]|jgi:hypothetical protein